MGDPTTVAYIHDTIESMIACPIDSHPHHFTYYKIIMPLWLGSVDGGLLFRTWVGSCQSSTLARAWVYSSLDYRYINLVIATLEIN